MFNKIKGLKLYAEAEEQMEEEIVEEPEEVVTPPEDNTTLEDNNSLDNDFSEYGDGFEDDGDFEVPTDYNANDYYSDQIVSGTEDEDSAEYKRRRLSLAKAYSKMYDKYKDVIINLKDIDATGDRAVVLTAIIRKYEELLEALVAYNRDCEDSFEVRYKTFIEFRAAFLTINEEIETINSDVQLIQ